MTEVPDSTQERAEAAGVYPQATVPAGADAVTFQWDFSSASHVTQVSLGAAAASAGTTGVTVQLRDELGQWHTVASAPGAVGEGTRTPYLLSVPAGGTDATAISVTVHGTGLAQLHDVHALGTTGTSSGGSSPLAGGAIPGEAVSAYATAP